MLLTLLIIVFVVWVVGFRLFEVASAAIHILIALAIFRLIFRLTWGGPRKLNVTDRLPQARRRNERAISIGDPLIRRRSWWPLRGTTAADSAVPRRQP